MDSIQLILSHVTARWDAVQPQTLPPPKDVVLWQEATRTIYVADSWGPAVPYGPVRRTDSESNFGYTKLKGDLGAVQRIPELQAWPEFADFVCAVNDKSSPLESVGCAIGFFAVDDHPMSKARVGSYVDLVFSDPMHSEDMGSQLLLAATIMAGLNGCEKWWACAEIAIQRLRHFPGATTPLGIVLRLTNHGRTESEAREYFRESLVRTTEALAG